MVFRIVATASIFDGVRDKEIEAAKYTFNAYGGDVMLEFFDSEGVALFSMPVKFVVTVERTSR
jgi:hypothetical protein